VAGQCTGPQNLGGRIISRIEINGDGHQVIVDHDGSDLTYIMEKAQKLWTDTKTPGPVPGPAYGFSMERDHGLGLPADKRWGGELDPVRAGETPGRTT